LANLLFVRKPKSKNPAKPIDKSRFSPAIHKFSINSTDPEALKRQISTPSQRNWSEGTLLYGADDAFPLRIAQAVEDSPAASACIDTTSQFIKGSGFADKELMSLPIDQAGTTLWDFHCGLADSLALFFGFAVNFKYDQSGKIINSYQMSFESCRLKEPGEKSPYITDIAYNPYFGTIENRREYTQWYPVFNVKEAPRQFAALKPQEKKTWGGQIYYYGKTTPLSRFYPKPSYWSAKDWIKIDARIQGFHAENLDNGFFQSVLMQIVGDPDEPTTHPDYQEEYTDNSGVKRNRAKKGATNSKVFNDMMSANFAGYQKAGNVFVQWVKNLQDALKIQAFPNNTNADLFAALQDLTTKNITIATKVPSILANISEGVSLGSGGSEMQKAIELMQSNTSERRNILQNFYNNVLLPNLQTSTKARVEILNYNPITQPIEIEDKFWDFLNEQEKIAFIEKNLPDIEIIRTAPVSTPTTAPAPLVDPETGETVEAPVPAQPNQALKNLKIADLNKIQKIVARYNLGLTDPNNSKAVTYEQAKQMLSSFGFTDEELNAWLVTPEEL